MILGSARVTPNKPSLGAASGLGYVRAVRLRSDRPTSPFRRQAGPKTLALLGGVVSWTPSRRET